MPVAPTPLIARIERAADRGHGATFISKDDRVLVPWSQLHDDARVVGAGLQARGIQPGDHVAILGPTSRPLVTAIQACWISGACAVVLPLPMRLGSLEEFVEQTRNRVRNADTTLLLIDPDLAPYYEPADGDPPSVLLPDLMPGRGRPKPDAFEHVEDDLERLAILQFTSGSTSEPKGVMLPQRVLCSNLDAIEEATSLDVDEDVLVSWLPLYHDMGLVGCLTTPMTTGARLALASPQDFLAHPGAWMEWISTYRGTATAGPNFSWVLATRALKRMTGPRSLVDAHRAEWRRAHRSRTRSRRSSLLRSRTGSGRARSSPRSGWPRWRSPARSRRRCGGWSATWSTVGCSRPSTSRSRSTQRMRVRARLPLLGKPVPGLEIRICDQKTGAALGEREVGELEISGTSVTPGYYKRPDATAELFRDGWLRTGDLAYMLDGELVLCGRIKDVIIIGGRNLFPEDIERAIGTMDGVRAGNVIAFGVEGYKGKESVVVVAETRADDVEAVRKAVHQRVLEVAGVPPRDVMLVVAGTMPKTSSGKLQRSLCKQRYLDEDLQVV